MPLIRAHASRCALSDVGVYRRALAWAAALLAAAGVAASAAAQNTTPEEPVRLRITWGGGEPTKWLGRIAVVGGTLDDVRLRSPNADATGSIWLQDNHVRVASMSAHAREAIEISAHGSNDSKLVIELSASAAAEPLRAEMPLSDVVRSPYHIKLDDRGNTLKVENAIDTTLGIDFPRKPLIYLPGEQLTFDLRPMHSGLAPGTTLDLQTTLSPVGSKAALWSDQQRLAVPVDGPLAVRLTVPLPRTDGVYTVRVAATRPPGFRERFFAGAAIPLAERSFQVVVLGTSSQASAEPSQWETVLEIDPTNPRWWDRLPSWTQLRRIPGLKSGPLGSLRAGTVNMPLGRFVELPPTAAGSEPHWQAYSLPLEAVGVPHQLEIEYPIGNEQHFGITIIEPNTSGTVERIDLDTGVYVEGLGRSDAKLPEAHRVVFWPRSQAPLLLVTNRHATAPAHFGRIRVRKRTTNRLAAATAVRSALRDRLVAAYIGRGLAAETFGAGRPLAADDRSSTDELAHDWQQHYESATRLADYLQYAGYNSAVVRVFGDGRAMYPGPQLLHAATSHSTDSPDRSQVDALELLLRVFDREQLALVPAVQFATPLPELEQLRRGTDPHTSGLEWVGRDGRTWRETNGSTNGLAAYYNLLDPRVQQAMAHVVGDLVERYGHHSALAGVAIQLSSQGYAQLPPLEWGLDDATIARFERDTGLTLGADGADRFAARHALLTGPQAEAWRNWRAARLTEFYGQLAAQVQAGNERRRLILTSEESLDHPQLAARVRPNILAENRVNATLLDLGIDGERLRKTTGVVFCATRYEGPSVPLRERAVDLEINEAFDAQTRNAKTPQPAAAMFFHRPNRLGLACFAAKGPFQFPNDATLETQPLAHGAMVRQSYATAVAGNDCAMIVDGGRLPHLGQEDMLRPTRIILQQLPAAAPQTEINRQPIFVRTYSQADSTTVLIVNASPWPTDAHVLVDLPNEAALEPLVKSDGDSAAPVATQQLAPGRQPWPVSLGPYEIQAVRIGVEGVQVVDVQAHVSDAAKAELAAQITDLSNRDTAPRTYRSLVNPSFEPTGGGGPLPGWQLSGNAGAATAELDASLPHDGKTCLYFQSPAQTSVLESNAFPIPATGQLAMTVFIRAQNIAPQTELRMVIEADRAGYEYRRSVVVGGTQAGAYPLADQWRCYPILVNDLPLEPQGQARIKFELTGPAEVWIDEVKTFDLLFPLTFYKYSQTERLQMVKEIQAAQSAYEADQLTDCVRRLEGYWPRFLASYTPLINVPIVNQPAANPAGKLAVPAEPKQKPAPGLGEKFKWLVPKLR